jgi:hypothetical protein
LKLPRYFPANHPHFSRQSIFIPLLRHASYTYYTSLYQIFIHLFFPSREKREKREKRGNLGWEYILGIYFGNIFWEYILGIYFGNIFWEYILGIYSNYSNDGQLPCYSPAIPLLFPCYSPAIPLLFPCYEHHMSTT